MSGVSDMDSSHVSTKYVSVPIMVPKLRMLSSPAEASLTDNYADVRLGLACARALLILCACHLGQITIFTPTDHALGGITWEGLATTELLWFKAVSYMIFQL
jgi:hypothetical protein